MIKYSIARPADAEELSKLFFKVFRPKYEEYLNYNLKEKTCRAISELYIKTGKTIIAKDKNKIIGFASAAVPLFSLWKQGIANFLPGRFMFIAPLRWRYLFKPVYLMLGVDPTYRRRGIGAKLSRELEKAAKEKGVTEFYTQIHSMNKPIKELLVAEGWNTISKIGFKAEILRKEL